MWHRFNSLSDERFEWNQAGLNKTNNRKDLMSLVQKKATALFLECRCL